MLVQSLSLVVRCFHCCPEALEFRRVMALWPTVMGSDAPRARDPDRYIKERLPGGKRNIARKRA
jgi:hypothetical protein